MPDAPPSPITGVDRLDRDLPCAQCRYNLRTMRTDASCPECGHAVAASIEAHRSRPGWLTLERFPTFSRVLLVIFGVAWPLVPFTIMELDAADAPETLFADWQSGHWSEYVGLLVGGVPARPFYPFLIFAMAAMIALIARPRTMGRETWVRLGLLVGVVMGVQYTLLLALALGFEGLFVAFIALSGALLVIAPAAALMPRRLPGPGSALPHAKRVWAAIGIVAGSLACLYVIIAVIMPESLALIAVIFLLALIGSPWLFAVAYGFALARCLRAGIAGFGRGYVVRISVGIIAYFTAWAGALALMLRQYQQLPAQPPHCYIATGAARGHRRLTGATPITLKNGQTLLLTRQLQALKAGELAIKAASPKLHRAMRRVYDALGPRIAARLSSPWRADLAYLLLVPVALITRGMLRVIVPRCARQIARLYRG